MGQRTAPADHRYQVCRDEFCERYICRVYKEGQRDGFDDGRRRGHDEGFADGYGAGRRDGERDGYAEGVANCPRSHT